MLRRTGAILLALLPSMAAHGGESPLVFQGNLFDALPEPYFPTMFRARDLDGDGFPDLVVPGRDPDHRILTLRGLGNGRFVPLQTLVADGFIDWAEVADIDRDGLDDIVAAWRGDAPELVVYRGIGIGLFAEATVVADVVLEGVGRDPQCVALGDYDADGDIDVAVTNYIGQSVDVFSNTGAIGAPPAFERSARLRLATFFGGIAYPRLVAAGDMDGDGDLDLVANEVGGGRIALLRNTGGRFARPVETRSPQIGNERPGVSGLQIVDVDGDGDLDVFCPALLLEQSQKVLAYLNDGTGSFGSRVVGEGSPTGYVFCAHLADLDGDGDLDALSGAALPGTIAVGRRTGAGLFSFEIDYAWQFGQFTRHIEAIDVDGDCDLDIVGIDSPSRSVYTRRNITPQMGSCGGLAAAPEGTREIARPFREPVRRDDLNEDGVFDACDVAVELAGRSRCERGGAP
jgi:FG-GAP-like repeat